jgi:hypothetical protein
MKRLQLWRLQSCTSVEARFGSVRDIKPCLRRPQLSSEAVAGCGRRLHRQSPSTGLVYWWRNMIKLRTLGAATMTSVPGQVRTSRRLFEERELG